MTLRVLLRRSMETSKLVESSMLFESDTMLKRALPFMWPTSERACYDAEGRMLAMSGADITRKFVTIRGTMNMNTLEMGSHYSDPAKAHLNKTMVMMPGFAAAVGLFYRNFQAFSTVPGLKVYAVDWLGTGRSSRVPFRVRPAKEGSVEAAESFFVESLEEWRQEQGIDKMILFGHSLGGYLSACYALKYPDRVEHLFLVSPAGVPASPVISEEELKELKKRRPFLYSTVRFLWERSFTPQGLIRAAGPLGPNLVRLYTDRRFAHLDDEEAAVFRDYAYHYNARQSSAETALHCLLDVGAWGRNPLINRVHALTSPTTFLYGSHDWMNPNAGHAAAARMTAPVSVKVIPHADHHLYIDNPQAFNKAVVDVIRKIQKDSVPQ